MKHISIVLMISLFAISCGKNSSGGSASPQGYINPVVSEDGAKVELFKMINKYRQAGRTGTLFRSVVMDNEADLHAQDMADGRIPYGHFGVQERCMRARRNSGGGNDCAELVARDQFNAQAAFNSWMTSNRFRAMLLDPRFNAMGVGVSSDRSGRVYWSVLFLQK
jgi:uncharacterized protein YkwD